MPSPTLRDLLGEFDRALAYTTDLQVGLTPEQIAWRPEAESSGIGWHLGHQGAVAHYMLRNLTAAEPSIDADIDALMDSATPERHRGDLPSLDRIREYRSVVAERIHYRIGQITKAPSEHPTSSGSSRRRCSSHSSTTSTNTASGSASFAPTPSDSMHRRSHPRLDSERSTTT